MKRLLCLVLLATPTLAGQTPPMAGTSGTVDMRSMLTFAERRTPTKAGERCYWLEADPGDERLDISFTRCPWREREPNCLEACPR